MTNQEKATSEPALAETSFGRRPRLQGIVIGWLPTVFTTIALLMGTVLRWVDLGTRSLWFDEGYTAWAVSRPVGEMIRIIRADTAPPLFYLVLREWTVLFGRSEAAMRSLSAVFATLTLWLFVPIARRVLKNPWAVTAAVCFFSLSFMQVAYAHEARFYAMMAFLGAVDFYLVLLVSERATFLRLLLMVLTWSASLYTNNMMAIYLGFLGLAWLVAPGARPWRRRLADLFIVALFSALSFAPWLPTMLAQQRALHGHFWALLPDTLDLARTIAVMFGVRDYSFGGFSMAQLVLVDVAIIGLALVTLRTRLKLRMASVLILFGFLPIGFVFFYSQIAQPIFMDRAFLLSTLPLVLLAAMPLAAPIPVGPKRIFGAAAVALIWCQVRSLPTQVEGTQDEDWRSALRFVVQTPAKRRIVVFVANEGELLYDYYLRNGDYAPRPPLIGVPASFFALKPPHTMRRVESDDDLNELRALVDTGKFDELVFVGSHNWFADPQLRTIHFLQGRLPLIEQKTVTRITVFRFGPAAIVPVRDEFPR
jgi:hypothetical protein